MKSNHSVVARRLGGMGDVLMAVAALSAVKRAAGVRVFLETSAEYAGIAAQCPLIDGVFTSEKEVLAHVSAAPAGSARCVDCSPAFHGIPPLHQVDSYLMTLGMRLQAEAKVLELEPLADAGLEALALPPPGGARILVHAGITDPNRTWPVSFWNDLCRDLAGTGAQLVLIGKSSAGDRRDVTGIDCPGMIDLIDLLSLPQTLELMRQSDVLVSGDSGPIQLAGATDIAIVGLYSVVAGVHRLPFRTGPAAAIAIAPACVFHPCYPRLNDPQAVAAFTAATGVAPGDVATLFSRWCVNPDRYACVREAQTLPSVLSAIKSLLAR